MSGRYAPATPGRHWGGSASDARPFLPACFPTHFGFHDTIRVYHTLLNRCLTTIAPIRPVPMLPLPSTLHLSPLLLDGLPTRLVTLIVALDSLSISGLPCFSCAAVPLIVANVVM